MSATRQVLRRTALSSAAADVKAAVAVLRSERSSTGLMVIARYGDRFNRADRETLSSCNV
jgi:hypothetical protein